jgi:hypothetical protein
MARATTSTISRNDNLTRQAAGEAVMNRIVILAFAVFFAGAPALGQLRNSLVRNGSFEDDGHTISYITPTNAPLYWCDVNMMNDNFGASLWKGGATDGNYYLELSSNYAGDFSDGDTGYISQQVYLDDVNEIIFDIRLKGDGPWNPEKRSAVILIDSNVVWESNSVGTDVSGLYLDQSCTIPQGYKDSQTHKLSVGIRVNNSVPDYLEYDADWDFIKFDTHCGGFGYLDGDLNQDCYVTLADLAVLGLSWMQAPASPADDLYEDGIVDYRDLALFAEDWLTNTDWTKRGQKGTFRIGTLPLDFDLSGEVDLGDLMILSEYWLDDGSCAGVELSGNNAVNFKDFAIFAQQWGLRDWLYYAK